MDPAAFAESLPTSLEWKPKAEASFTHSKRFASMVAPIVIVPVGRAVIAAGARYGAADNDRANRVARRWRWRGAVSHRIWCHHNNDRILRVQRIAVATIAACPKSTAPESREAFGVLRLAGALNIGCATRSWMHQSLCMSLRRGGGFY